MSLRSEVIVRFVDIGGRISHHCLNVLFIILFGVEISFNAL